MDTAGFEKPKSNLFKFGKEGDAIKGIYLGAKDFEGNYGPTKIYEIEGIDGSYHDIVDDVVDENPTEVKKGESYSVFSKNTFADDISKAVPGQQVIIRFTEQRKSQANGKNYKMIECLLGPVDPDHGFAKPDEVAF